MRTTETILGIIQDRGRRRLPLEDVYRQLFNPALYRTAYARISSNKGALTPGTTTETVDGMSEAKILDIIENVRYERYRWSPARRIYVEKKNSTKKRPLGMPTWSDKLLQEVIRMILNAYYEPQFSEHSHGFRPGRGCGTALEEINREWRGTNWFIEGDISSYFDTIDHTVMIEILRMNIHDNRFLRLIENLLKAGYLEDWKYNTTLSGTPQGGVVSPILSDIYLDMLDQYVVQYLTPAYNRGEQRGPNPKYRDLSWEISKARRRGDNRDVVKKMAKQVRRLPGRNPNDPDFKRLRYVRYADVNRPEFRRDSSYWELASKGVAGCWTKVASNSAGGIMPNSPCRRRWLNQSTYSRVAYSTSSRPRQGPAWRISSALYRPLNDSARALS